MIDPTHPIAKLLKEDRRYKIDAYAFVFEALNYAHTQLGMSAPLNRKKKIPKNRSRRKPSGT